MRFFPNMANLNEPTQKIITDDGLTRQQNFDLKFS
jgi:hypothetical protein